MTREEIETRKAELGKLHDQAVANVNALRGAMQDCDFWLERLVAAEAPQPPPPHILEDK